MKRTIFILLLVLSLLLSISCNGPSAVDSANAASAVAKSSDSAESAPAAAQAASTLNIPPDSSAASSPAASDISAQQASSSSVATSAVGNILNPTNDIAASAPIPDYAAKEALWNNTLSTSYRGERLLSVYALDVKNHLTVRYSIAAAMSSFDERYFATLLESCDPTPKVADRAFILFTDKGRHYIYLDQSAPAGLTPIWETIYNNSFKTMHWLTHMTTGKIEKIAFSGWSSGADMLIGLTVEDSATIAEISDFLKNSLTVNANRPVEVMDAIMNPSTVASAYSLSIKFDNGIGYFLLGYGDYGDTNAGGSGIDISTSDLGKTISYMLNEGAAGRLRDFMAEKQIEYWQKNGYPTRMNVKILPATSVTEKLVYSKDLSVPLHITNNSEKAITVTTDFVTRRRPLGGGEAAYVPWGEGYPGESSESIPAGGNAVIWVPFSGFDLPEDGRGKYQTEFWVDGKFKINGSYVVT